MICEYITKFQAPPFPDDWGSDLLYYYDGTSYSCNGVIARHFIF